MPGRVNMCFTYWVYFAGCSRKLASSLGEILLMTSLRQFGFALGTARETTSGVGSELCHGCPVANAGSLFHSVAIFRLFDVCRLQSIGHCVGEHLVLIPSDFIWFDLATFC